MLPLTLLSLALATITRAAEVSIDTQKITAGDKVKVTIENATETGSGYQSYKVDKMRIGLYNSIYNAYMCSLTDLLDAKDGQYEVTIPKDVGPSGEYYRVHHHGYDSSDKGSGTGFGGLIGSHASKFFFLSGATGSWTPIEADKSLRIYGLTQFDVYDIPCSSYACARKCAQTPKEYDGCVKACSNVQFDKAAAVHYEEPDITKVVSVASALPTPTGSCKEEDSKTPCGSKCCGKGQYCLYFETCVDEPLDVASLRSVWSSRSAASATRTRGSGDAKPTGTVGDVKATGTATDARATGGVGSLVQSVGGWKMVVVTVVVVGGGLS